MTSDNRHNEISITERSRIPEANAWDTIHPEPETIAVPARIDTGTSGQPHHAKSDDPEYQPQFEPYELAFLRGGGREVLKLHLFALVQDGYLAVLETKKWLWTTRHLALASDTPPLNALTQVERDLLNWFSTPQSAKEIFRHTFPESLRMECDDYREKLAKEGMLKGWIAHHGEVPESMYKPIGLAFPFIFILVFLTHSVLVFWLLFFSILAAGAFASIFVSCRPSAVGSSHLRQMEKQFAPLNNPANLQHQAATADDSFIALAVFGADAAADVALRQC
jgi:uncharacterized protein (TIGR04222 family)